jgi:transposase-like protein
MLKLLKESLTELELEMEEKQSRWTAAKKAEVVLRLLRGETMDAVSRECEVTVTQLTQWREDFIAAGVAGLKGKTLEEVRIAALEKKIGQQAMELELHEKKDQFMRARSGRTSK